MCENRDSYGLVSIRPLMYITLWCIIPSKLVFASSLRTTHVGKVTILWTTPQFSRRNLPNRPRRRNLCSVSTFRAFVLRTLSSAKQAAHRIRAAAKAAPLARHELSGVSDSLRRLVILVYHSQGYSALDFSLAV